MIWDNYLTNTKNSKPRPLLVEAFSYTKERDYGLDLGAGALNDLRYLISVGFKHVDVVDFNPQVARLGEEFQSKGVTFYTSSFHDFEFRREVYDLVNAQYALPFAGPEHVDSVLKRVSDSLKQGGVFVGNFFGIDDEWITDPRLVFMTKDGLENFFDKKDWDVNKFHEEHATRPTADGVMKKWHIFNIIATKIS